MANSISLKNYPKDVRDTIRRARRYSIAGVCLVVLGGSLAVLAGTGNTPKMVAVAYGFPLGIVLGMAIISGAFSVFAARFRQPLTTAADALRFVRSLLAYFFLTLVLVFALYEVAARLGPVYVTALYASIFLSCFLPGKYAHWVSDRIVPKIYRAFGGARAGLRARTAR